MGENKSRHTVWLSDTAWAEVENHYRTDNCSTKNEYIEKAIRFYSGYLDTEHADSYLPRVLSEVLEGKLDALGGRIGRQVFKLAVEESIMVNLLAYDLNVDLDTLKKLRVRCVKDVKEINGGISFDKALQYQKGAE